MIAAEFLRLLTHGIFVTLFVIVAARAASRPTALGREAAVLFGAVAVFIGCYWFSRLLGLDAQHWLNRASPILVLALPYLLLRMARNFTEVRPAWLRTGEIYLLGSLFGLVFLGRQLGWIALLIFVVAGFILLSALAAYLFWRGGNRASGVTRRRAHAVAIGIGLLGLTIVVAGLGAAWPAGSGVLAPLSQLSSVATGVAFYLGFATPAALRHAWQAPELRLFLGRTSRLISTADGASALRELAQAAAAALGAQRGVIGLLDDSGENLLYRDGARRLPVADAITGLPLRKGSPIFWRADEATAPEHAERFRGVGVAALLAAPIEAAGKRYGVLSVVAPHGSVFEEDDLDLLKLLADHSAVILEARVLVEQATRVRAREESARSKEDFLSAAAHDLRNPLSTIIMQAHLLERKAARTPPEADLEGVQRLLREAQRLRDLISDLLDAASAEAGRIVGHREVIDVAEFVRATCERLADGHDRVVVRTAGPVEALLDEARVTQLVMNLLQNALKYSPGGDPIEVAVKEEGDTVHIEVRDRGIGIPEGDLAQVFERFHRGSNVDDRRYPGMGLGLFICKAIVEQHGGRLWAESIDGAGTCMHVVLPKHESAPA